MSGKGVEDKTQMGARKVIKTAAKPALSAAPGKQNKGLLSFGDDEDE